MDKHTVKYFDQAASSYADRYVGAGVGYGFRVRRERLAELFDRPGGKVLDVGCASGVMIDLFRQQDCEYWGVDPAPQMIEQAKKQHGDDDKVHVQVAGAEQLPFDADSFDAVVCAGVIERVPDNDRALAEMARVLHDEGTVIISYPNRYSPHVLWRFFVYYPLLSLLRPLVNALLRRPPSTVLGRSTRLYSARQAAAMMQAQGLQPVATVYFSFKVVPSPLDELAPVWANRVAARLEFLSGGLLRWMAGSFMIKAVKKA